MSIKKRILAFSHAFNGVRTLIKGEVHAKFHALSTIVVIGLGFYLNVSATEWTTLLLCTALVWSLEAANSAIENLTDLVTEEIHPLAKKAKDLGAAAVLIAAFFAVVIGCIIFIPKLL